MLNLFRILQVPEGDGSGKTGTKPVTLGPGDVHPLSDVESTVAQTTNADPLSVRSRPVERVITPPITPPPSSRSSSVSSGGSSKVPMTEVKLGSKDDLLAPGKGGTNAPPPPPPSRSSSRSLDDGSGPSVGSGSLVDPRSSVPPTSGPPSQNLGANQQRVPGQVELQGVTPTVTSSARRMANRGPGQNPPVPVNSGGTPNPGGTSTSAANSTTSQSTPAPADGAMGANQTPAAAEEELDKDVNKQIENFTTGAYLQDALRKAREAMHDHGEDWISRIMASMSNIARSGIKGKELEYITENFQYIADNKAKADEINGKIAQIEQQLGAKTPLSEEERNKLLEQKADLMQQKKECIDNIKTRVADMHNAQLRDPKPWQTGRERHNANAELGVIEKMQSGILRAGYAAGGVASAGVLVPPAVIQSMFGVTGAVVSQVGAGICGGISWGIGKLAGEGKVSEKFNEWYNSCVDARKNSLSFAWGGWKRVGTHLEKNTVAPLTDWTNKRGWQNKPKGPEQTPAAGNSNSGPSNTN